MKIKLRIWHLEMSMVALVLFAVIRDSGGGWIEWVGAGAVLLSFGHAQVADRLAEAEAARTQKKDSLDEYDHRVTCHDWALRYLVGKELLWCLYFVMHHSWSALAGVGLFLAYPLWRRWYRKQRPL